MSADGKSCPIVKCEDYTPGYLSTNQAFDPQTASFFYEPGEFARAVPSSSSSHHVVKSESTEKAYKIVNIKKELDNANIPAQRVPSKEYLEAQRQYQQNLLQRRQYLLTSRTALEQRSCQYSKGSSSNQALISGGATSQNHQQPHNLTYQQQQRNYPQVQYSTLLSERGAANRLAPGPQRLPSQIFVQPSYSAEVQPTSSYFAEQMQLRSGVQYASVPVRYVPYDGELEPPIYVPPQGQVAVPPGTIVYTQDGRRVTVQPTQYAYAPVPVEYVQDPALAYDNNGNLQPVMLNGETSIIGQMPVGADKKKKRQSKRAKAAEGEGGENAGTKRRRGGRRKKGGDVEQTNQQADGVTDGLPHTPTHGEVLRQKKRNMAFPKGTFLVRYADLDNEDYAGHIWLVDNHQLLQKYTYDGLDAFNVKVFSRTERYSGWLCTCPWLYHPLTGVKGIFGNLEKVAILNYPTKDELFARRELFARKEEEQAPPFEPAEPEAQEVNCAVDADEADVHAEEEVIEQYPVKTEPDDTPIKIENPDS
ncbi:unnamed protein product [Cylicocyclus nassatus]|uniref:Uncharacterized protein n=1 Tax=Cylicocyclus nassatus TaxID=53992 RepID=A0AA36DUM5_CYLNA|nr:unnamed protein product [Cylicocyclus nassatus]